MENYKEELKKYFKELEEKKYLLANMHPNGNMSPELYNQLLYNPKSVLEINVARSLIGLCESFMELIDDIQLNNIKEIDPHDCRVVKYYGEFVKRLKNNEDYSDLLEGREDFDMVADFMLEGLVAGIQNTEEFINAMMEASGYDPDDEDDIAEFLIYKNRADAISNELNAKEELTEENKHKFIEFVDIFKNKCNDLRKDEVKELRKKKESN